MLVCIFQEYPIPQHLPHQASDKFNHFFFLSRTWILSDDHHHPDEIQTESKRSQITCFVILFFFGGPQSVFNQISLISAAFRWYLLKYCVGYKDHKPKGSSFLLKSFIQTWHKYYFKTNAYVVIAHPGHPLPSGLPNIMCGLLYFSFQGPNWLSNI